MALPNIIRYFRDCYEEDNRRSTLWNIFQASVTHRLFVESEEQLLTGFLAKIPVDFNEGREVRKAAYLYQKEKELVYCSLFVFGRLEEPEQEPRSICAPLLIHPAEIIEQQPYAFLKPDLESRRVNHHLLDALEGDSGQKALSRQARELLGNGPIEALQIYELSDFLEEAVPQLDAGLLREYPNLVSQQDLKNLFAKVKEGVHRFVAVSCSVAALINKSVESRGVINELTEIAETESHSAPLRTLFSASGTNSPGSAKRLGRVPAVLNTSQQAIIDRGATSPLTLVIGPPGTGKSFTIAALAVEHLSRGQSVLIASKMNHAVDVVADKIETLGLVGCAIRGGRKQYLRDLKQYLDQLLSGMHADHDTHAVNPAKLENELRSLDRELEHLERRLHRRSIQELKWGRALSNERVGVLQTMLNAYIGYRVRHLTPLWKLLDNLERLLDQRISKTTKLVQILNRRRIAESLGRHRQQFITFLRAIRARTGMKQDDLFNRIDFNLLLSALPVWLVNLADIHDVLPLKKDLFDLAIIDEATQCDIASCLPIFQRARRVVISGDPNQLRHLSFLPAIRQKDLLARYRLAQEEEHRYDYRGRSILDVVNDALPSQRQIVYLNEHYRSLPPIIEFSNKRFYANSLLVMTQKPGQSTRECLTLRVVEGKRNRSGVNELEANLIVSDCIQQIESEQSLGLRRSIGILSPFRAQADHIAEQLSSALPLTALQNHEILIGTAHTFQGEERDVLYISLTVDSSTHPAAIRFLEKPDVFNVSITRARALQRVYISIEPAQLGGDSLLRAYLNHVYAPPSDMPQQADDSHRDRFLIDVETTLRDRGCEVLTGYKIAGGLMDLVVSRDGRTCGIDLVGYPGTYEAAFPLERYKMFHRAGLLIIPLTYSGWTAQRDRCLRAVEDALTLTRTGGSEEIQ